jgi:hypothetical protein
MPGDCWIRRDSVVRTHVFPSHLVSGGACEAPLSVAISRPVLRSMVKSEAENDMEAKFLRTSGGGPILCGDEELVG